MLKEILEIEITERKESCISFSAIILWDNLKLYHDSHTSQNINKNNTQIIINDIDKVKYHALFVFLLKRIQTFTSRISSIFTSRDIGKVNTEERFLFPRLFNPKDLSQVPTANKTGDLDVEIISNLNICLAQTLRLVGECNIFLDQVLQQYAWNMGQGSQE